VCGIKLISAKLVEFIQLKRVPVMAAIPPEGAAGVDLKSGPFSVRAPLFVEILKVLVNVRNNHKLLARVKAYDRHM
jgi:hypothetical protein